MSDKWYYVEDGERKGPMELTEMQALVQNATLGEDDFIWTKGMENWTKVKDVSEVHEVSSPVVENPIESSTEESFEEVQVAEQASDSVEENSLQKLSNNENSIFIKIGADRGGANVEYGPYSLEIIKKLFKENRINGKTFVFLRGMSDWKILADFEDFSEIFEGVPPVIDEEERRASKRKPFVARMFFESGKQVFVGICRDVSVGGMQVLVDQFPAPIGDTISINVHPENTDHHFVASGQVVRHLEGGHGFSFRFIDLKSDAKEAIEKYLDGGA